MNIDAAKLEIDADEVLRYAGVRGAGRQAEGMDALREEIYSVYAELSKLIIPKFLYKTVKLENMSVMRSSLTFKGSYIEKFLCGADKAALMVVTLGHEYEQYVKSRMHMGDSKGNLIIDAVGTEVIEKCADLVEEQIRKEACEDKSSRFSPGYGDFGIDFQKPLLEYLGAHRIGVYCNEHYMMFPQKTVTAIVKFGEFKGGCGSCEKLDCSYRVQC